MPAMSLEGWLRWLVVPLALVVASAAPRLPLPR